MPRKPTAADAELILKLYDLRREAEMRKARLWWLKDFWPQGTEDFLKLGVALGSQENNWLRQVAGYWEMAASLVLHGTLSEELFLEVAFSGEMFHMFAKVRPFLDDLRRQAKNPAILINVETLINRSKTGRNMLKQYQERIAERLKMMKEASAARAT
jgi:hypothetical protein